MANHALNPAHGKWPTGPSENKFLADTEGMWYLTQREQKFAPVIGHERLVEWLSTVALDAPRREFLETDRASLGFIAKKLRNTQYCPCEIKMVRPGTIMFANEPFAAIQGPWALTQLREVLFLQAFDKPTAVAGTALQLRHATGDDVLLSDFSLRRSPDLESAQAISDWAIRGLFDDTSNMEFSFHSDVPAVGTMAHHLVQAYTYMLQHQKTDDDGKPIHFETYAFMKWLDSHPNGTVLLIDTLDIREGLIRAMEAALSTPERRNAFKGVRIDSGDNTKTLPWIRSMLAANGFTEMLIIVTNQMSLESVQALKESTGGLPYGFGIGTALSQARAGVIFKNCAMHDGENWIPTVKLSSDKQTIAGPLQVWRCEDSDGNYFKDVITRADEPAPVSEHIAKATPLLGKWSWKAGNYQPIASPQEQREYIARQLKRFRNLDEYPVERSTALMELQETAVATMKQYTYPKNIKVV